MTTVEQDIILELWNQFAYEFKGELYDGGLSALESAYAYLTAHKIIDRKTGREIVKKELGGESK
jgi:hypothetical protein